MQQVDAAVPDIVQRTVEVAAQQLREPAISGFVECRQVPEDILAVEARVLVALPGVDREAARIQPGALHRLAERRVRDAGMGAQLDQLPRSRRCHQPVRERQVAMPGAVHAQPRRPPEQRVELLGQQRRYGIALLAGEVGPARVGHRIHVGSSGDSAILFLGRQTYSAAAVSGTGRSPSAAGGGGGASQGRAMRGGNAGVGRAWLSDKFGL